MLLVIAVLLAAIFLAGRYGCKLGGFRAFQGTGITSVEVSEKAVHVTGFYPGSFPEVCGKEEFEYGRGRNEYSTKFIACNLSFFS